MSLKKAVGLFHGEAQVGGPQLAQLPADPETGQGQRGVDPGGQHQVRLRRQVVHEEGQGLVDRPRRNLVVVVQDQHEVAAGLADVVHQGGQHCPYGGRLAGLQQGQGVPPQLRLNCLKSGHDVGPEPLRDRCPPCRRKARPRAAQAAAPALPDSAIHSLRRVVLPNPAGAQTTVSRQCSAASSRRPRRGRLSHPGGTGGTCSLVISNRSGAVFASWIKNSAILPPNAPLGKAGSSRTGRVEITGAHHCAVGKGWWAHPDSNQGPTGYEPAALPLSYEPMGYGKIIEGQQWFFKGTG